MNERRRLANESKAIIAKTRQTAEELRKCVARSRTLLAETKLLLAQSRVTAACPDVRGLGRAVAFLDSADKRRMSAEAQKR